MSQKGREHIMHTFARVFERNSDTGIVMQKREGRSIFTNNPYRMIGGIV